MITLSIKWETHHGVWITSSSGPFQAKLHDLHVCKGGADQFTNWDSLPDFNELAGACRFRDGRESNPYGAPPELYPYLALTLGYCRANCFVVMCVILIWFLTTQVPSLTVQGKETPMSSDLRKKPRTSSLGNVVKFGDS